MENNLLQITVYVTLHSQGLQSYSHYHGIFSTERIKEVSQYFKQQQQKWTLKHKLPVLYFLIQYPDFTFPHFAFSTILPAFSNLLPKMLLRTSYILTFTLLGWFLNICALLMKKVLFERKKIK
jgi:hypothetical protein